MTHRNCTHFQIICHKNSHLFPIILFYLNLTADAKLQNNEVLFISTEQIRLENFPIKYFDIENVIDF